MAGTNTFGAKVSKAGVDVKDSKQPGYKSQAVSTRESPIEKSHKVNQITTTEAHDVDGGIPLVLVYRIDTKYHALQLATADESNYTAPAGFVRIMENKNQL